MKCYYVMGKHTSVAWTTDRELADKICKQLNYRGGTIYTVKESEWTMGSRPKRSRTGSK